MMLRPMIGPIAPRIILRDPRRKSGCRWTARILSGAVDRASAARRGDWIDAKARQITLADGRSLPFDRLLLATGAEPIRLDIPGADRPHVHLAALARTFTGHCRQRSDGATRRCHWFELIGLEAAAALRTRGLEVHVVAPERAPLERVLGPEVGAFIRACTKSGAWFSISRTRWRRLARRNVQLKSGRTLPAELVVVGVGVRPGRRSPSAPA